MIAYLERTQSTAKQNRHQTLIKNTQTIMNKQQQNQALERTAAKATLGLKLILLAKSSP